MKRIAAAIALAVLWGLYSAPVSAEIIPTFSPSECIYWGTGQIIHTDNNGVIPNVGDWNGDGLKDLLVGVYYNGNVYYYQNSGTNEEPVFTNRVMLNAGGNPIALTSG